MGFCSLFLALRIFGVIASTKRDKTDFHGGQTPKDSRVVVVSFKDDLRAFLRLHF